MEIVRLICKWEPNSATTSSTGMLIKQREGIITDQIDWIKIRTSRTRTEIRGIKFKTEIRQVLYKLVNKQINPTK